jgi:hypothetical protein
MNFGRKAAIVAAIVTGFFTSQSDAITIGPGRWIGTDKRGTAWYEEFQDWSRNDVRALDANDDQYKFNDEFDPVRDIVAFYSREEGDSYFFRVDFFDNTFNAQIGNVDLYVAIDCALGGTEWFPDFTETRTSNPWELCVAVYSHDAGALYNSSYQNIAGGGNYYGSYWRSDLDGVEFGIKKQALYNAGWNGSSPIYFQVFTCRDGTNGGAGEIGGSDIVDSFGTLSRDTGNGGYLAGAIPSTSVAGRAKYAVIAHANQSVNTQAGTQNHILTRKPDVNLYPGFVRLLDSATMLNAPVNLHISGTLLMSLMWAKQNPSEAGYPERDGPTFVAYVKQFLTSGPGALIGGTLAEHIMPYFEGDVNRKSIEQNNELVWNMFGLGVNDMKVMHVPERVFHSNTAWPAANLAGPLKGKPFEDIVASGFPATYLDEVTHLHWWFYPNEQNNAGWDDANWGRWAGGQGNDEETYHHKVHKINGVLTFMINDREDQSKFGNDDGGMMKDTRYTLLRKALSPDSAQITVVFDDWEAYAGNSFGQGANNNADQFHATLRWAANHQWIEIVKLKDVVGWAQADPNWVIDHGYVYDKSLQTYEWLKHASESNYDFWYYGNGIEENFANRIPAVHDNWYPAGMKRYGDMNAPGTLIRDSWDAIQSITAPEVKKLAEWSYSAMIYETAWHDENPPSWWPPFDKPWLNWFDAYKSKNYQTTFQRPEADSYADDSWDPTSYWALTLHGHVRDMGVLKEVGEWVRDVKNGTQPATTWVYAKDIDDDKLNEYVLRNNKVFLCFERWGARLVKAFVYDPNFNGGDARCVIGAPVANPPGESENEGTDSTRCSALKDRFSTGYNDTRYVDLDFASPTAPQQGANSWTFTSQDGKITKKVSLDHGADILRADYTFGSGVGTMYTRHGLGPNQVDLMLHGPANLSRVVTGKYRGLKNSNGGEVFVVTLSNCAFVTGSIANAGWEAREMPLVEQFETYNTASSCSLALTFSQASADALGGNVLQWVGNTYTYPASGALKSTDDLWINTETWPIANGQSVAVGYRTDSNAAFTYRSLDWWYNDANNSHWHVNLGKFPAGTTVEYFIVATQGSTTVYDNRGGANYFISVSAPSVQWAGNVWHWPPSGQITAQTDFWVNIESWPKGAATYARVVYSTNGGATWFSTDLELGGQIGNNDWWHVNLGRFASRTTIRYAIEVRDANGKSIWANNNGADYYATVK